MISREAKAAYYALLGMPMRINGMLYRAIRAPASANSALIRVQLGPGLKNYLINWINLDANLLTAKRDVWANLEDPLPFRDNSVDVFYSHHVIEHIPDRKLFKHFIEMRRCLKRGGMVRVGGPNGDMAIRKYLEGDATWFSDFPDRHSSIGGKFKNFIFCRNEHLTILTPSYLQEIASLAGFENFSVCIPGRTTTKPEHITDEVLALESWSSATEPHTLIIECYKPASIEPPV